MGQEKYETGRSRNELWGAYLESVQYGLDYVLGVCKCLRVFVSYRKRVCNITPHLIFDVTNIDLSKKEGGVG